MNTEIAGITKKLRSLGVEPSVLKLVRDGVKNSSAPRIAGEVIDRLRDVIMESRRAILVLGRNGDYSVFSPAGHAALCASAKKHKPWAASMKSRAAASKSTKH
jgi:hypothetical protein